MEKDFKDVLVNTLKQFAKKGMVFTNEQNFQFELGSALKRKKIVKDVYFEVFSIKRGEAPTTSNERLSKSERIDKNTDESNREYTDLIIELTNGEFIAIELKYKLAGQRTYYKTGKGEFFLTKQSGVVSGSYNFIKDIKRLEDINNRYLYIPGHPGKEMTYCFSILLTNNKRYWKSPLKKYNKFSLEHDKILTGILSVDSSNNKRTISLDGSYKLHREKYKLSKCDGSYYDDSSGKNKKKAYEPGFSYLIIEVEPR